MNRLLTAAFLACTLLSASACDQLFSKPQKPAVKHAKVQKYDAQGFVTHISTSIIALENGASLADISDSAKVIEGYSKTKKAKPESFTLVVLDYNDRNNATRRTAAPVRGVIGENGQGLDALSQVVGKLGDSDKLKDVRVMTVSVSPGEPIRLTEADALEILKARQQHIISGGRKISGLTAARAQLKLLRFFMNNRHKDAAYICADNVKRSLSTLPQEGVDSESVNTLATDLEAVEGELRSKLPY